MKQRQDGTTGLASLIKDGEVKETAGDRQSFVLRANSWAGGACDVGMHHRPNQDAIALAAGVAANAQKVAVACVSDGVSTSPHAEEASALAVETACSYLANQLNQQGDQTDLSALLADAFTQANQRICQAAGTDVPGIWACTLVVSVFWSGQVAVGNVGDSRSYWFPDQGQPLALSTDDSLAQAQIDLGVPREAAESGSGAHSITKWLGPGSQTMRPTLTALTIEEPGWLMTCSDGLWNYASQPELLAEVLQQTIDQLATDEAPIPAAWSVCCQLVDWANDLGGHDNIAVTLLRLTPAESASD